MRAPDTLPSEVQRDLDAMDATTSGRRPDGGDAVLAELAALLAEDCPAPDPDWARALDARAAKGFAKPSPARRRWLPRSVAAPGLGLAACAVLALAIGLAGGSEHLDQTTSGAGSSSSGGGGGASSAASDSAGGEASDGSTGSGDSGGGGSTLTPSARDAAPPSSAPAPAVSGGSSAAPAPLPSLSNRTTGDPRSDRRSARKVERSATMTLGARRRDLDAVADGVASVTTTLGGFVASSNVSSRGGGTLDLRVPAGRLDDAIARLSRLAHVRRLERSTLDITAQAVSAKARIAALKAERRSLLRQLEKAVTLDETDRLRRRVSAVNRQLEAARAQSRRVENRAQYANLNVEVVPERAAAAAPGGWTPRDAWHDALRVLEVAAGIALIAFAVALPLVLLGAPAWIATRRLAQRRRERALDIA
jgi:hypothetical protein